MKKVSKMEVLKEFVLALFALACFIPTLIIILIVLESLV
jgi:hypothetical protein